MESFELLYWHWIVLGIALVVLEIFLASFAVLWFGLGAIIVGILLWIFPAMSFTAQLFIWAIASVVMTLAWFKYFKPRSIDKTRAGITREALIGECGQVIKAPIAEGRGMARFSTPVLGSDEWEIICDEDLTVGDRIAIREFSGNTLIVSRA